VAEPESNLHTSPGLVVIGASAGGLRPLEQLLLTLPTTFNGSVAIVLHLAAGRRSLLASILGRMTRLPVNVPIDGRGWERRQVYVAPPDRHLAVDGDVFRLPAGPKENGYRPAIDVLFRSAAVSQGPRVTGVVLSGSLDDGAAGLREIKAHGGRAAVQDPDDADYSDMPRHALSAVTPDFVGTATDIAAWLGRTRPSGNGREPTGHAARPNGSRNAPDDRTAQAQPRITCPDCHGALHELEDGHQLQYECLIGHRWSPASLASFQANDVEIALSAAVRALEEQAELRRRLMAVSQQRGRALATPSFARQVATSEHYADLIRKIAAELSTSLAQHDDTAPFVPLDID